MEGKDMKTIFMVEDDRAVLGLNKSVLEREGYTVLTAETLARTRAVLAERPRIDLVLLDIVLPDGNGMEFLPELRRATDAPVMMLTAMDDYGDMVEGLTGGADEYMTKPYRIEELLARIVGVLHRRNTAPFAAITRGPLMLELATQRALIDGKDMQLTPKEFALLLMLARNEGKVLSVRDLYEGAWKSPMAGDANAVRMVVFRLRGKLASSGYRIASSRGEGYAFQREEPQK